MHRAGTHVIRSAKGSTLIDEDGRELLDGLAGLWCVNVGYGRDGDRRRRAPSRCARSPSIRPSSTPPPSRRSGSPRASPSSRPRASTTSIFSNSGSEANETALKLIRAYWKLRGRREKTKILVAHLRLPRRRLATTSLTGLPSCTEPFDLPLPGFLHVPGPHRLRQRARAPRSTARWCLEETERTIAREGADTIAAFFAEPVQGAGGVIVPPAGLPRGAARAVPPPRDPVRRRRGDHRLRPARRVVRVGALVSSSPTS